MDDQPDILTLLICGGLEHIAELIFGQLDNSTIAICRQVCKIWECHLIRPWLVRQIQSSVAKGKDICNICVFEVEEKSYFIYLDFIPCIVNGYFLLPCAS